MSAYPMSSASTRMILGRCCVLATEVINEKTMTRIRRYDIGYRLKSPGIIRVFLLFIAYSTIEYRWTYLSGTILVSIPICSTGTGFAELAAGYFTRPGPFASPFFMKLQNVPLWFLKPCNPHLSHAKTLFEEKFPKAYSISAECTAPLEIYSPLVTNLPVFHLPANLFATDFVVPFSFCQFYAGAPSA